MIKYLALVLCFGTVLGARERRQVNCVEPAVTNVCQSGLNGPLHFPHPTDKTKFLQCAPGGRMFIIKCPDNEIYNQDSTSCGLPQPVVTVPPVTLPPATQPALYNPCTAQGVASGNLFFPYPSDNTKFIECTNQAQPLVLQCPTRLVYSATKQGCILPAGSNTGSAPLTGNTGNTGGTPLTGNTGTNIGSVASPLNPCKAARDSKTELFFPHPDPTKFFHCDVAGNAFIQQCPANLVWDQKTSRCGTAYNLVQSNVG